MYDIGSSILSEQGLSLMIVTCTRMFDGDTPDGFILWEFINICVNRYVLTSLFNGFPKCGLLMSLPSRLTMTLIITRAVVATEHKCHTSCASWFPSSCKEGEKNAPCDSLEICAK